MMKTGKRILMLLHWLLSLLICAALAVCLIAPDLVASLCDRLRATMGVTWMWVAGIALLVIYAALAAAQISLILGRKRHDERGFITVDSSDASRVRIAVSALEQMVRQSVRGIDGITDMKIDIESQDDAIDIGINASIASGSHVPTLTANIQRSIRQFVEINCGVAVRAVSVSINAVTGQPEGPHRRRLGRGKQTAVPQPVPAEVPEVVPEAPEPVSETPEAFDRAAGAGIGEASDAPAATDGDVEVPAFDLDRPYESEFEKDLAELRAMQQAQQTAEAEAGEAGDSGDKEQL